jgi:hypothetical protein
MRTRTIFDGLREQLSRNGAWKTASMQSEHPVIASTTEGMMDSSGIGQAWTTSRSSRIYAGGGITPQLYTRPPMNVDDQITDAGKAINARAAYPGRGITPRSPLVRRS